MIQRIQSLYLLIVVVLSLLLFFLPVSKKTIGVNPSKGITKEISYKMNLNSIEKFEDRILISTSSNFLLLLLNAATGIISLIVIFLYRKRSLQIKICGVCLLFTSAFIAADFFYFSDQLGNEYGTDVQTMYLAGSYFPIIQIILLIMAIRAIKKDEELVRSAERIR